MSDTATGPVTDVVTDAPRPLGRFTGNGLEWHRHTLTHAHENDRPGHHHVMATDLDTITRLQRLLEHVSRGQLPTDSRTEAQQLLALTR